MIRMKLIYLFVIAPLFVFGQIFHSNNDIAARFKTGAPLPDKILSTRSVVLYSSNLSEKEVSDIHESLSRTGIDAVAYFEIDKVFAGADVELAFSNYFPSREIVCVVIVQKGKEAYKVLVSTLNNNKNLIDDDQPAWSTEDKSLNEALRVLYSTALNTYKRQNMLIGDAPETDLVINVISGRRTEAFASDLKIDKLAVQKFGDENLDHELETIMKAYPFKYGLVENTISEPDLRKQGYFYILRFVNTRGQIAKQLLGYDVSKAETAIVSIAFANDMVQVKTISSDVPVFKFYTRQIEFNNVHLGTKWDADVTWQQALVNFISGFKREMGIK